MCQRNGCDMCARFYCLFGTKKIYFLIEIVIQYVWDVREFIGTCISSKLSCVKKSVMADNWIDLVEHAPKQLINYSQRSAKNFVRYVDVLLLLVSTKSIICNNIDDNNDSGSALRYYVHWYESVKTSILTISTGAMQHCQFIYCFVSCLGGMSNVHVFHCHIYDENSCLRIEHWITTHSAAKSINDAIKNIIKHSTTSTAPFILIELCSYVSICFFIFVIMYIFTFGLFFLFTPIGGSSMY